MNTKKFLARAVLTFSGVLALAFALDAGIVLARGQRYESLVTPTPLPPGSTLVLGFHGGRDSWDDPRRSIRKLALKLRGMNQAGVHAETVENTRREVALELVKKALDTNRDARLDAAECASARIILYGQSFGGAAVIKFAKQLETLGVPVLLTVQIDSVGREDEMIPPNVAAAANLYQDQGRFVRGEPEIRAADSSRTRIVGNFRYDYRGKKIDISGVPWFKKLFRNDHTRMEHDPEVWARVESLLLAAIRDAPTAAAELPLIRLATELGEIKIEVDVHRAPATAANFLRYLDGGFYDGGRFHRTVKPDNQPDNKVKIEVIQAGINPEREKEGFPPVALQRTSVTGLRHKDGTVSMARLGPDTATSDFFICIGDQPELDFGGKRNPDGQGFAAFGRVLQGMDVVRKIQQAPAEGQRLTPAVKILRAKRHP